MSIGPAVLPFADAATPELPMSRLLRLSLFQVTVGMAAVLLIGTLNRVMIVELTVPSWIVAGMLSLPLLFAPLRALVGFRSDNHRSVLGWRRVPYIWFGTMAQFGGFAIMPFALLDSFRRYDRPALGRTSRGRPGVSAGRRRSSYGSDCWPRLGDRPCARTRASASRGSALCNAACRHGGQRGRVWHSAGALQRGAPHPGRSGRGGCHDPVKLRRALEAGASQHPDCGQIRRRGPVFSTLGPISPPKGARADAWSRPRLGLLASACRTFCLSPMAEKSCTSPLARRRHSPRCSRSAAARA